VKNDMSVKNHESRDTENTKVIPVLVQSWKIYSENGRQIIESYETEEHGELGYLEISDKSYS